MNVKVGDGWFLRIDVVWPSALSNVPILMEMWLEGYGVTALSNVPLLNEMWLEGNGFLKIEEYHPQVQGFYDFFGVISSALDRQNRVLRSCAAPVHGKAGLRAARVGMGRNCADSTLCDPFRSGKKFQSGERQACREE